MHPFAPIVGLVLLMVPITIIAGAPPDSGVRISRRMINGSTVTSNNVAPWVAALLDEDGQQYCVATVVRPNWLITTALCTRRHRQKEYEMDACHFIGHCDLSRMYSDHDINSHPYFRIENGILHNNIAVINIKDAIPLPFELRMNGDLVFDSTTKPRMYSWGYTGEYKYTRRLQMGQVRVMDGEECESTTTETTLCVEQLVSRPCYGDVGSPLVINDQQLVGILSIVPTACGKGRSLFEQTYAHLDWIESAMERSDARQIDKCIRHGGWCAKHCQKQDKKLTSVTCPNSQKCCS